MRTPASLTSYGAFCTALVGWRLLYQETGTATAGILCLVGVGLVSLLGGYRVALGRKQALLSAAIEPGSGLSRLMTGRVGAIFAAVMGTGAALPVAGYFTLIADWTEVLLAFAGAAWAMAMVLLFDRLWTGQLRSQYRISIVSLVAIWASTLPVVGVALAFTYFAMPVPDYATARSLPEALDVALSGLPRHHWSVFEFTSALRSADAFVHWALHQNGYQAVWPLALFLIKGAITYLSVVKLAVDWQAAFRSKEG